jgi:hypothetical protein
MSTNTKRSNGVVEPHEVVASSKKHPKMSVTAPNGISIVTLCVALLLFVGNVVIQSWGLKTQALPGVDEGVYLYQAKLITQGYLPYKDFAMTSHVPFLMYLNAFVLKICNFDLFTYHLIYIAWVFSTIFPLFYTVLYFTRSRVASLLSIVLFSTFAELVQCDAHFFAIRQASLPFFACFVYFFFVKKQAKLSQVFLSLFSFCLITNFLISLGFGMTLCLYDYRKYNISIGERIKIYARTCWIFVLLTGTYFGLVALIPHSLSNLLAGQKVVIPYLPRLRSVIADMPVNGPIFLFGGLGIMFCKKNYPLFSILSILTFLISMFASASYFNHYITTIAVPFAIMGGLFINRVLVILSVSSKKIAWVMKIAWICIVFFYVYIMVFSYLYADLITQTTPNFFQDITVLEKSPEPLFTLQPTYALYAHKNLVMYYNTADIRVFFITGTNLSYEEYHTILNRSNTVLLEPLANYMLPEGIKKEILQKYYLKYTDGTESIYIRKTLTKTSTP